MSDSDRKKQTREDPVSNYLDKALELLLLPNLIQKAVCWNSTFDGLHCTAHSFVYIKQPFSVLPDEKLHTEHVIER